MPFREDSMECIEGFEDLARERMRRGQPHRPRPRMVAAESEHGPSADAGTYELRLSCVADVGCRRPITAG